jgi:hypothetical protein
MDLARQQIWRERIGLMIRRTRTELVETIERSRMIYGPMRWKMNETEKIWRTPNGARLRFAYLERDADADIYHAQSTINNDHHRPFVA